VIRRGRHHLPQPAESRPLVSCSSACRLNPVIRFAIGRRQVTMTDCDEQSVIRLLQSAHNDADYGTGVRCVGTLWAGTQEHPPLGASERIKKSAVRQ
jgi:hypothetical protein